MKCPTDGTDLQMTERQGIEIDYCPKCRGVWLDRGELDKIIERSATYEAQPEKYQEERYSQNQNKGQGYDQRKRKRGGFLGDLLDFGD